METVDHRASTIARRQRGYATRRQLLYVASVSAASVTRRLAAGQWSEPLPGVIDLGTHRDSARRMLHLHLLATGPASWVSHGSAASLHRFLDVEVPATPDILVLRGRHTRAGAIRLHTTKAIAEDEVTIVRDLRCTVKARTLLDLAAGTTIEHLERYAADLGRRDRSALEQLGGLLDRYPCAPGRRRLITALSRLPRDVGRLGSPLEVFGVSALLRAGAPDPVLQYRVRDRGGAVIKRVDAAWPDARTVIEFDGAAYHDTARAQQDDEVARERMRSLGWTVEVLRRADLDGPRLQGIASRLRMAGD